MCRGVVSVACVLFAFVAGVSAPASAELRFFARQADDVPFVLVEGEFDYRDDLTAFTAIVRTHHPQFVTFNSPGGNIAKAIELGRLIREAGLATVQIRQLDCVSACALAFFGGVKRDAAAGSIGMHKMSFGEDAPLDAGDAARSVQNMTALVMLHMRGMGVDPALLGVVLLYDPDDIRYLSTGEMVQYGVVTNRETHYSDGQSRVPAPTEGSTGQVEDSSHNIPAARTGRVRHPTGTAPLKMSGDEAAAEIASLPNGTRVTITSDVDRWYGVTANAKSGFVHHTWVFVDQFRQGPFDGRYIQIKSFRSFARAEDYIRSSRLSLAAMLASNGWVAVTLDRTLTFSEASGLLKRLKEERVIPDDAYVTYGNTYVRRVCCE